MLLFSLPACNRVWRSRALQPRLAAWAGRLGATTSRVAPICSRRSELPTIPSRSPSRSPRREAFLTALLQFRLRNRHPTGQLQQCSATELHFDLASSITTSQHHTSHSSSAEVAAAAANGSTSSSSSSIPGLVPRRAAAVAHSRGRFYQPSSQHYC